jgi:2-iminobutanoate/2-iminopropanoate deaminase
MPKQIITTSEAGPPLGAYSQGVKAGDFIFVTGCGPISPETGKLEGDDIEAQTGVVINNLAKILEAAGASLADAVKSTVHLRDPAEFSRFNEVYAARFPEPRPARTTVGSNLDAVAGMRVEIDLIAYVGP